MTVSYYNKENPYKNCKDEAGVKSVFVKEKGKINSYCFLIETSETILGFPDVVSVHRNTKEATFYEFKIARKGGIIEFEKDQISFYIRYKDLDVLVVAYDVEKERLHVFSVAELFRKSVYKISMKRTIELP